MGSKFENHSDILIVGKIIGLLRKFYYKRRGIVFENLFLYNVILSKPHNIANTSHSIEGRDFVETRFCMFV